MLPDPKRILLFSLLAITSHTAHAQFSVSADAGWVRVDNDAFEDSYGLRVGAGYSFNDHVQLHGYYTQFEPLEFDDGFFSGGPLAGENAPELSGETDLSGFQLSVVGRLPVSRSFGVSAHAGLFAWDSEFKVEQSSTIESGGVTTVTLDAGEDSGTDPVVGVGAWYTFTERLEARIDASRYEADDVEAYFLAAGVVYVFGR